MIIKKKVQKEYFDAIIDGRKRFEVRLANFKCKPGDTLILQEQHPETNKLTGREIACEVLYNFNTKEIEKFYKKKDVDKYGLSVLAVRKKYMHR
jgi:ASC-1-like (ASCH) protein